MTRKSGYPYVVGLVFAWILMSGSLLAQGQRGGRGGSDQQDSGRRQWDPTGFLQRLDRNGNKMLDVDEMSGRSQGFLQRLGIDTSNPVPIQKVLEKIESDRREASGESKSSQSSSSDWNVPRLVPGFGEAQPTYSILGFGVENTAKSATTATSLPANLEATINTQIDRLLSQFDENKNGILEPAEIEKAPWGRPTPQESDLNGDGILTRDELVERYRRREADNSRMNGGDEQNWRSSRGGGPDNSNSGGSSRSDNSRRWGGRDSSSESRETSTPASSSSSTSPASSSSPSSTADRIASYVENLLKQYDKNFDGVLDADEISAMRSAPKNADQDGDGRLSRDELTSYYGGGYRAPSSSSSSSSGSTSSTSSSDSSKSSSSSGFSRRRDSGSSRSERSSSSSTSIDGSRPVYMYEFAKEWDDDKLEEYYKLDLNRDGVITTEEFRKARR